MKFWPILFILIYILSPFDLIPDFIQPFGLGHLDDLILLIVFLLAGKNPYWKRLLSFLLQRRPKGRGGPYHQYSEAKGRGPEQDKAFHEETPWEILGVPPNASPKEIKAAYKKKCAEYHPDKVSHLGADIQKLADLKFRKIQEAYRSLKNY